MNTGRINFLKNKKQLKSIRTNRPSNLKILHTVGFVGLVAGFAFVVGQKSMLQFGVRLILNPVVQQAVASSPVQSDNRTVASLNTEAKEDFSVRSFEKTPAWVNAIEEKKYPGFSVLEKDASNGEILIQIQTDPFFQVGTAKLIDDRKTILQELALQLKNSEAIEVEGHTDDSPIVKQRHLYQSNWDLSAARAASVVAIFEDSGISKSSLKLIGLGDSMPLLPNRDGAGELIRGNAAKNRRVLLRVTF